MARPYAVVIGEALVDLLEDVRDGQRVYREAVGGAPLNVAVGVARLGHPVELVGSLGDDVLGRRVRQFLAEVGVGTDHLVPVDVATTIALLQPRLLATALAAWSAAGAAGTSRAFDPNVRPRLVTDVARLRQTVEEFAATADLVKLSAADAAALYGATPGAAAGHLIDLGARAVVVTLGAAGALVRHGGETETVPAPRVAAVDATGA